MAKTKQKLKNRTSTAVTLSERMERRAEFKQRQRIKLLCAQIKDQSHLDSILIQEPNSLKRRAMFEMYRPHLTFTAVYDAEIATAHSRPRPPQCTWNDEVLGRCRREGGFEQAGSDGRIWACLCIGHRDRLVNAIKSGIQDVQLAAHVAARGGRADMRSMLREELEQFNSTVVN